MKGGRRKSRKKGIAYIPGESYAHALDPRSKLLAVVVISILSLLTTHLLVMALLFSVVVAMALMSGISGTWARSLRLFIPLVVFVFVLDALFTPHASGGVLFEADLGWITVRLTPESIHFALSMCLRLVTIGGCSFLFIMTTPFTVFAKSLRSMKLPRTLSFSLGYALKSTTSLSTDACNIMDAQRSRGLEFKRGSMVTNMLSLFIPMTVSVMKRSDQVSAAMQCRGYGSGAEPSMYRQPHPGKNDLCLLAVTAVLTLVVLALTRVLTGP